MANTTHVVTGEVRLSYCNLLQPRAPLGGGEPKYSVTVLVPKSDSRTITALRAAIEAATQAAVSKSWGGVRPPRVPDPIHDGDGVRPSDGAAFGAECKGHWVFTASSRQQPGIVDANINPIIQPTEIYSGMYGRVSVDFYGYNQAGKRGIGCGLVNVQKLRDGEPLGATRASTQDDFGTPAGTTVPTPPSGYDEALGF